jgi:hypothetical protein
MTRDQGVHRVRWGSRDHFLVVRLDVAPPERWSCADVVVTAWSARRVLHELPGCAVVLEAAVDRVWTAWSRDGRRLSVRNGDSAVRTAALAYVLLSRVTCGGTSVSESSLARRSTAFGSSTWTYRSSAPE